MHLTLSAIYARRVDMRNRGTPKCSFISERQCEQTCDCRCTSRGAVDIKFETKKAAGT